jgi:hypothetical protein
VVSELRSSGAEEDAAGKKPKPEIHFSSVEIRFFCGSAWQKLAQGRRRWETAKGTRQRWATSSRGAPALETQVTGALLNKIRVFCEGALEGEPALTFQLKGAPASHDLRADSNFGGAHPYTLQGALKKLRSAPPFIKHSYEIFFF